LLNDFTQFGITKFRVMSNFDKTYKFNVKIGHIFFECHSSTFSKKMTTERDTPGFMANDVYSN
ncbi:MAG: hypothetical protein R6W91_00165, partial [Thermoplasmata archaeon]